MNTRRSFLSASLLATACAAPTAWAQSRGNYRTLQWDDLLPEGWNPQAAMAGIDASRVPEGSPQELELQRKMRKIWDSAPVRAELAGERERLAGYVVPLEYSTIAIRDFLLVPFLGACVHSPPPPANQIVMVTMQRAVRVQVGQRGGEAVRHAGGLRGGEEAVHGRGAPPAAPKRAAL